MNCLCYDTALPETIKYLFIDSEPAQRLWTFFGQALGIKYTSKSVQSFLQDWWQTPGENAIQNMMIQITPMAWELWKSRCSCIYGNQTRFYIRKMVQQILWNIKAAMDKAYPLHKIKMRPKTTIKYVIWNKPMDGLIKVNTDDSYLEHNGKAGIGGIARNNDGKFIFAFAAPITTSDHNVAEALAAKYAVEWMVECGYKKEMVKLDSMLMVKTLQNGNAQNTFLRSIVEGMAMLNTKVDLNFEHCFRESDSVADCLAKLATTLDEPTDLRHIYMPRNLIMPIFKLSFNSICVCL
ncbi:hypothetical protein R3W88_023232 [Solanum pinnatisectum]|uniref:RNase H type-1 domain-containing protein n=1 Tax=Solanum pinnatisectum TaxID=50273 RepID=A0AAV9LZ15_9SOLN|nr:hypothetical protein R3W88_023232 [Solanum pinnatisectum]